MRRKLKVAVVMGGGWSLGAFTGGAVWELVRQLHANRDRERYDRCEIDVLSGAGAGALTVSVLLRTLANPEGFAGAAAVARAGEAQRAAWLDGADFTRMLRGIDMRKASLLDRSAMDEVATELLRWPSGEGPHPVLLSNRVLLGVTLLNFNGVPVNRMNTPRLPRGVSTTSFHDHRVFCVDFTADQPPPQRDWRLVSGDRLRSGEAWRELAATAVASGAFPIAFEPVVLQRYREEFGALWPAELGDRDEFPFTYGDGGPFHDEPLRDAMRLIALQDADERPGSFERLLIFVDPNLSGSKHAFGLRFHLPYMVNGDRDQGAGEDVVRADPAAHLVAITNRYGVLARHQGAYEDFVSASKVNERHAWRTELRSLLQEISARLDRAGEAADLAAVVEARLACVLGEQHALAPGAAALDVEQLVSDVAHEQTGARPSPGRRSAADRLAYALMALVDEVADLRGRRPVRVVVVGPTEYTPADGTEPVPVKLAGDFFANFGGFFDARFRVHDFDAGRALTASSLATVTDVLADPTDRPAYTPWSDRAPSLEAVPAARDRFVRRIGELTRQLLEYKIGYLGVTQAISIVAHYVAPKLVRDSGPGRRPAIARIEVASTDSDAELYLAGRRRGERGGDARRAGDSVVLHTVLHYSDKDIVGPHVLATPAGWVVRLAARRNRVRDPYIDIPLPDPALLHDNADCGLPIHRIHVDWAARTTSGWTQEDALREWPGGYEV